MPCKLPSVISMQSMELLRSDHHVTQHPGFPSCLRQSRTGHGSNCSSSFGVSISGMWHELLPRPFFPSILKLRPPGSSQNRMRQPISSPRATSQHFRATQPTAQCLCGFTPWISCPYPLGLFPALFPLLSERPKVLIRASGKQLQAGEALLFMALSASD